MKRRVARGTFIAAGVVVALALAFFVGPQASSEPDGLNRVAIDKDFAATESAPPLDGMPTAGYALEGVDNEQLSTGVAGVIGVTLTFALTGALFLGVRRLRSRRSDGSGRPGLPITPAG